MPWLVGNETMKSCFFLAIDHDGYSALLVAREDVLLHR